MFAWVAKIEGKDHQVQTAKGETRLACVGRRGQHPGWEMREFGREDAGRNNTKTTGTIFELFK